jgi:hypothetical protein
VEENSSEAVLKELLRQKEQRRKELAQLPVEQKVEIIGRMIEIMKPALPKKQ